MPAPEPRRARSLRRKGSNAGSDDRRHRRYTARRRASRRRTARLCLGIQPAGPFTQRFARRLEDDAVVQRAVRPGRRRDGIPLVCGRFQVGRLRRCARTIPRPLPPRPAPRPNTPAGCVPAASIGSFEFDDENSQSYEAGLKSRFADDRAEINLAYYFTDFKDLQVSTFDGVLGFNVSNAGAAEVQGIELDGRWKPIDSVMLRGSLAWTDFEYKEFVGQCYIGQTPDAPDGRNCDYAGKTNIFVPDLAGSLAVDWFVDLGQRCARHHARDGLQRRVLPAGHARPGDEAGLFRQVQRPHRAVARSGNWEIALLGRNLSDEIVTGYAADIPLAARTFGAPSYGSFVAPPRSVALQARYSF